MKASADSDRKLELAEAIVEYRRVVARGGVVDPDQFVAKRPHLAHELRAFLEEEQGTAEVAAVKYGETAAFTPTPPVRAGSRGLQIRCPHCSNQVEMLVDTPYEEISCGSCGSAFSLVDRAEATQQAAALKSVGRFELISRLGIGGFGSVWKARDRELDRVVAIKIPRKGQLEPGEVEQFFREARAAAQLRHPNIVPVHEVGRDGDTIFIVCDLVRGVELSDWLTGGRVGSRDTAELCIKIAMALHHAHQQGVVHRDLKPSNVMIDEEGEPHIMDFGLAKREAGEITMTMDGQVLGTPAYMSPEQAAGRSHWTDRRTDIYSLGVMLYLLLSGELPFRGNAQMQVYQRLTEDPTDPRKLNRHIPRDLATICLKCLERDPNKRYSTSEELAEDLTRFMQGRPILARPISPPARLVRWAKRQPALATIAGLVVFMAVAGPLAAARIEGQRRRLAELVTEKDNLIKRDAVERTTDTAKIAELTKELDLWEGRTNPWKFWPPNAAAPPRRQILQDLYKERYEKTAAQLESGKDDAATAYGQLAWGLVAAETGHAAEAATELAAAEKSFETLTRRHPDERAYWESLAECYEQRARLAGDAPGGEAKKLLEKSSAVHKRLGEQSGAGPVHQVARFDSALRTAAASGFDAAGQRLDEAEKLRREIAANWPDDPLALYEFVRQVLEQEPHLAAEPTAASGN